MKKKLEVRKEQQKPPNTANMTQDYYLSQLPQGNPGKCPLRTIQKSKREKDNLHT